MASDSACAAFLICLICMHTSPACERVVEWQNLCGVSGGRVLLAVASFLECHCSALRTDVAVCVTNSWD